MSHSTSQWSHVDDNVVHKGKDLPQNEIKANKPDNVKVETMQEAARPPSDERIRDEASTPKSEEKKGKKRKPRAQKEEGQMDKNWKDAYRAMFKSSLNKKDIDQIIHILEKMERTNEFALTDEGLMYYKGQLMGNVILIFFYLFKRDKNRSKIAKQVNMVRKMLHKNGIHM
jgi:hypothetical protein